MSGTVNHSDELIDELAEIEQEQWRYWSQAAADHVSPATRAKWQRSWKDFSELTQESKEADRVRARKVVTLLRRRNLVQ